MLFLYYYKSYGHQTWQSVDLLWEVTQPIEQVVTWGYVMNWKHTSTTTMPMATKLGKVVGYVQWGFKDPEKLWEAYVQRLWELNLPCNLLNAWSMTNRKSFASTTWNHQSWQRSHLSQYLLSPNLWGWWLTARGANP